MTETSLFERWIHPKSANIIISVRVKTFCMFRIFCVYLTYSKEQSCHVCAENRPCNFIYTCRKAFLLFLEEELFTNDFDSSQKRWTSCQKYKWQFKEVQETILIYHWCIFVCEHITYVKNRKFFDELFYWWIDRLIDWLID